MKPILSSSYPSRQHGVALVLVLCFVVLLTGLVVAYFSRTLTTRQLSTASTSAARKSLPMARRTPSWATSSRRSLTRRLRPRPRRRLPPCRAAAPCTFPHRPSMPCRNATPLSRTATPSLTSSVPACGRTYFLLPGPRVAPPPPAAPRRARTATPSVCLVGTAIT